MAVAHQKKLRCSPPPGPVLVVRGGDKVREVVGPCVTGDHPNVILLAAVAAGNQHVANNLGREVGTVAHAQRSSLPRPRPWRSRARARSCSRVQGNAAEVVDGSVGESSLRHIFLSSLLMLQIA